MKYLIISKNNLWTNVLLDSLKSSEPNFNYSAICSKDLIDQVKPDWIFFFHWSDIVDKEIYNKYKCVVVHTGLLPKDRGGSPLQNQIIQNQIISEVNLLEMSDQIDAGRIYSSHPITLQGNITDIWLSIAEVTSKLIKNHLKSSNRPLPQIGEPQTYKRIKNNKINIKGSLLDFYNQIRMVDDPEYPTSFLEIGDFKLEFSRAKFNSNNLIADVKITKK